MKPSHLKVIIPIAAIVLGLIVVVSQLQSTRSGARTGPGGTPLPANQPASGSSEEVNDDPNTNESGAQAQSNDSVAQDAADKSADEDPNTDRPDDNDVEENGEQRGANAELAAINLSFRPQEQPTDPFDTLGADTDATGNPSRLILDMSPRGAGIHQITLLDYYRTLDRSPDNHHTMLDGIPDGRPALGLRAIVVNGQWIPASGSVNESYWRAEVDRDPNQSTYIAELIDEDESLVLTITREFALGPAEGQITIRQSIRNHTDEPLAVSVEQWGPADLTLEKSRYGDYRRFRFGYLDPRSTRQVFASEGEYLQQRSSLLKDRISEGSTLVWPNETSRDESYTLAWVAATSRYFSLAAYPHLDDPAAATNRAMQTVEQVHVFMDAPQYQKIGQIPDDLIPTTYTNLKLYSPTWTVGPNSTKRFDLGGYAGPLDRPLFAKTQPYRAFNLKELIVYQLTCAFCTFQWLAHLLINFLRFIHDGVAGIGVHDWGLSIIILVLVVRAILHPLTKRGQVSMQKFSKRIQALQPELKKLQEKYADNPKKLQQEQMKLYREHNVNPVGCLGMAPMFLQMPIWVALYAMLYFAIELRQQPAFYGLLQLFGNWSFLADLSQPDRFIDFGGPIGFLKNIPLLRSVEGVNLLPILMGAIFYLQQKYMTPQNPNLTPEQETQQKIMRILFPVMFPVMLYNAPAGLTLYIMTSSCVGIVESRYIRAHVSALEIESDKPKKPSWWRRWLESQQERIEAARAAMDAQQHGRGGGGRGGGGNRRSSKSKTKGGRRR